MGITESEKEMSVGQYWLQKSIKEAYPTISKLGLWCSYMPTSNAACERSFAVLRSFEGDQHWSLLEDSIEEILMAKVNIFLTDSVLITSAVTLARAVKSGSLHMSSSASNA